MATRPFLEHFWKKCIFPFENAKTLRKISKNWCWTCKKSGTSLKLLAILCKMTARLLSKVVLAHAPSFTFFGLYCRFNINICTSDPAGMLFTAKTHIVYLNLNVLWFNISFLKVDKKSLLPDQGMCCELMIYGIISETVLCWNKPFWFMMWTFMENHTIMT